MKRQGSLARLAVAIATVNLMLPLPNTQAMQPPAHKAAAPTHSVVRDVALEAGGRLRGQMLNSEGQPIVGQQLVILQNGKQIALATTDQEGRFTASGLHGGLFQVLIPGTLYVCRGWAAGTAPPVANDQLLVITSDLVQRGQRPFSSLLGDPVMIGLMVATAITIPLAISASRKDPPPGS